MIKSNLRVLMGEKKIKSINKLSIETGITRRALTRIYNDEASQIDLKTIETLCEFFDCTPGDLLYIDEEGS